MTPRSEAIAAATQHIDRNDRWWALAIVALAFIVFSAVLRPLWNRVKLFRLQPRLKKLAGRPPGDLTEADKALVAQQARLEKAARSSPLSIFAGKDGRVSSSKTVALAWTIVIAYVLTVLLLVWPPSWDDALHNLSPTYLLFLAGPYASLVFAKGIVSYRTNSGSLLKTDSDGTLRLSDLVSDDSGDVDVFDVQFLIFNAIALWFVIDAFQRATLAGFPDLPSGLVLLTGGPAAVYLSNKTFGNNAGVTVKSVTPTRLDSGEEFVVLGSGFLAGKASSEGCSATLNGFAIPATDWTDTRFVAVGPSNSSLDGIAATLTVFAPSGDSGSLSSAVTVDQRPEIKGFDRASAKPKDQVVMMVDWPRSTPAGTLSTVNCGSILLQGPPVGPGSHTIAFAVPESTSPGNLQLIVHGNGHASDPKSLTISA